MATGFIKNSVLLEERVSNSDYLDISSSITTLSEKISAIETHLVIGIIGAFGVGKSTLISKTRELRKDNNEDWIHFDAWQFPDRKELWDGLVLETAKHLSSLEPTKRKLAGTAGKDKKLAVDTVASGVNVATTLYGLPAVLQPLFSVVKNLEYFTNKSPATRVFEIQEIFADLINSSKKEKLVFVLEDVDRSGEAGLFFLETFRQFLSTTVLEKQVVVIVAISNKNYYQNIDSYLKCLDFVEFFNKKDDIDLKTFIAEVFQEETPYDTPALSEFLGYIYNQYPEMNMRKIKLILRQANLNYIEFLRAGFQPNRLICIAAEAAKYIFPDPNQSDVSLFRKIRKGQQVETGSEINRMIMISNPSFRQYTNEYVLDSTDKKVGHTVKIKLIKRPSPADISRYPSTPYDCDFRTNNGNERLVCLPNFYFQDL